jgi:predicted nucleotide-binding protein
VNSDTRRLDPDTKSRCVNAIVGALGEKDQYKINEWLEYAGAPRKLPDNFGDRKGISRRFDLRQLIREIPDEGIRDLLSGLHIPESKWAYQTSVDTAQKLALAVAVGGPIFVVHGRDHASLHYVVRVLQNSTGREIVVLHEQANAGRTILEKFEQHAAGAAYAVVLLTADDEGGLAGGTTNARARQNVIFELGFFFAELGRKRVAVLVSEGVEKPSDIDGLVYIDLDAGGAWKHTLVKELEAAGVSVDYARIP